MLWQRYPFARHNLRAILSPAKETVSSGVVLGQTAAYVGLISVVWLVVYAGQGLTVERSLAAGLLAPAGALLQTGFSLAI
jgi:hypothetical protein